MASAAFPRTPSPTERTSTPATENDLSLSYKLANRSTTLYTVTGSTATSHGSFASPATA